MTITEAEALKKLCPRAIGAGNNEWVFVPANRMCAGAHCMAWRWAPVMISETVLLVNGSALGTVRPVESPTERSTTHGYCGIAGRL